MKVIALEEHFIIPEFVEYLGNTAINLDPHIFRGAVDRLTGFEGRRIEHMDKNGIDFSVLSMAGPGVQIERDTQTAIRLAKKANDVLADAMANNPTRFGGLAHLALQDPIAAADELERCIKELGFQGAMINGTTNGYYLDAEKYYPFWERVEELNTSIYIHPANPVDKPYMYIDHPELYGPTWSWTVETATHALRLVFGGIFDRYPKAKLILGHMGETLPYLLWRFDSRWKIAKHGRILLKEPSAYIKENIYITTSGVCAEAPLQCALSSMGEDHILFACDYPFEDIKDSVDFINTVHISKETKEKILYKNAEKVLNFKDKK